MFHYSFNQLGSQQTICPQCDRIALTYLVDPYSGLCLDCQNNLCCNCGETIPVQKRDITRLCPGCKTDLIALQVSDLEQAVSDLEQSRV